MTRRGGRLYASIYTTSRVRLSRSILITITFEKRPTIIYYIIYTGRQFCTRRRDSLIKCCDEKSNYTRTKLVKLPKQLTYRQLYSRKSLVCDNVTRLCCTFVDRYFTIKYFFFATDVHLTLKKERS